MLTLDPPPEIERRLEELAKARGLSASHFASEAILEQIADLEDLYLADEELIAVREGRGQTTPLENVMKEDGLARRAIQSRAQECSCIRSANTRARSEFFGVTDRQAR